MSVVEGGVSIAAYAYDAGNQRISKTTGGVTTRYAYDRNHVALELTGAATTPNVRYLYGTQVDQILAQDKGGGNVSWQLTDQLGSVRALVGNDGIVRNRFEFDAFGNVVSTMLGATDDSRYRYTGREFDAETGLNYYRARYFDSFSGRFIGQDPIGFSADDANLYRYVGNKVINHKDPSGKVEISYEFSDLGGGFHHIDLYLKTRTWQETYGFDNSIRIIKNSNKEYIIWKDDYKPVDYTKKPRRTQEQFNADMKYDRDQRQLIYSDPNDPRCIEKRNLEMVNYFKEVGEEISSMQYPYNAFLNNSNTAMRAALVRTAARYPDLEVPTPKYNAPGWNYTL